MLHHWFVATDESPTHPPRTTTESQEEEHVDA